MKNAFIYLLLTFNLLIVGNIYGETIQENFYEKQDSLDNSNLNWYNLSPDIDNIQGADIDRAYSEILPKIHVKKKIIVAVIDSGVDIDHVDLQNKIWVNIDEVPNNGIDDDNNGYIDDVNGWNFLGNSKGENVVYENIELVRIIRDLDTFYGSKELRKKLSKDQMKGYKQYKRYKREYKKIRRRYKGRLSKLKSFEGRVKEIEKILENLNKNIDRNHNYSPTDKELWAQKVMTNLIIDGYSQESLNKDRDEINMFLEKALNFEYVPREKIIGDDTKDITNVNYGNNDVEGSRATHGTFVSGIIAAGRNNDIGINGIAENVEIMAIRAVPRGDERDKDIALAIRYAVDNGANIINMSFGKSYSPQKKFIDDAIKYAEKHNVLLVHSAGNNSDNLDKVNSFPTKVISDQNVISSWITVGANSKNLDEKFCGKFTNYGRESVDLFAPGVDIVSLVPDNKYDKLNGTSFSSPVVSGVAALVWSYYPELSAVQLKKIILKSVKRNRFAKVMLPGKSSKDRKIVKFGTLSVTGGVVNAVNALKLADSQVKKNITQGSEVGANY